MKSRLLNSEHPTGEACAQPAVLGSWLEAGSSKYLVIISPGKSWIGGLKNSMDRCCLLDQTVWFWPISTAPYLSPFGDFLFCSFSVLKSFMEVASNVHQACPKQEREYWNGTEAKGLFSLPRSARYLHTFLLNAWICICI